MENTNNTAAPAEKKGIFPGYFQIVIGILMALCAGVCVLCYNVNGLLASEGLIKSTTPGNFVSIVNCCSLIFATGIGGLAKKWGIRIVSIGATLIAMAGLAVGMVSPVNDYLWYVIALTLGINLVANSKLGSPILINNWFQRLNKLPMALVIAAASFTSVFAAMTSNGYQTNGKVGAYMVPMVICAVSVVASLLFMRDDPKKYGEVKDGVNYRLKHNLPMVEEEEKKSEEENKEAKSGLFRNTKMWVFSVGCLLRMGVYAGSAAYITMIIISRGFTPVQAGAAVASLSLASTVGRITTPFLTGALRLNNIKANCLAHLIAFAGCALVFFSTSITLFTFAVMLIGYSYGYGFVSQTLALSEIFPEYNFSNVIGVFTTLIGINFIFPSIYGYIGAALGNNYTPIYLVLGIVNLAFAFIVLTLKPGTAQATSPVTEN